MIYGLYFSDNGSPKTGLSPTFNTFIKKSDSTSVTPPTISELSGGWYKFTYIPTEDILIVIDSNDVNMADIDRYVSNELAPEDVNLDAAISGRASSAELIVHDTSMDSQLANIQTDLDNPAQYKADVSSLALESTSQLIKTEVDKIQTIDDNVDTLLTRITATIYTAWTKLADVTISGSEAAGSLFRLFYDRVTGITALDSTVAKEATLTVMKGAGWSTETLKAIYDVVLTAGIKDWTDAELKQIRDALGIDGTKVAAVGGQVQDIKTDITVIKKIETGRWKIIDNQMIIYDTNGTTPLYTFDLKDANGNATEIDPIERTPV